MGLPRFLQHAVGVLPSLGFVRGLLFNYWSGCVSTGEEERLRKRGNGVGLLLLQASLPINAEYHIFQCKCIVNIMSWEVLESQIPVIQLDGNFDLLIEDPFSLESWHFPASQFMAGFMQDVLFE